MCRSSLRSVAGAAVEREPRGRSRRAAAHDVPETIRAGADLVIDGGELPGVASTVVDLRRPGEWSIVREGAVSRDDVARALSGGGGEGGEGGGGGGGGGSEEKGGAAPGDAQRAAARADHPGGVVRDREPAVPARGDRDRLPDRLDRRGSTRVTVWPWPSSTQTAPEPAATSATPSSSVRPRESS